MSMIFYNPDKQTAATVAQHAADLHVFGVRLQRESGETPTYQFGEHNGRRVLLKHVGDITVWPDDGRIVAWPLRGLSDAERHLLLGSAARAFRCPPSKSDCWVLRRDGKSGSRRGVTYWWTAVLAVLDEGGSESLRFARMDRLLEEHLDLADAERGVMSR